MAASSSSQQECCCDCGYVTKSSSSSAFKLGLARPASPGGCRALSADDVSTAGAANAACRPLSADVSSAATAAAYRPLSAGASRAATPAVCRPMSADVSRAATAAAYRPVSAGAGRTLSADVSKAGRATLQNTFAVDPDGADGEMLRHSLHTFAALTPDTQEQNEYRSPLSHLQHSFRAELGFSTSLAVGKDGPSLKAGQGQGETAAMAGHHCFLQGSAEVELSAAAADLGPQNAGSVRQNQQLELSPVTSFLQLLDQCQQTDPESPKAQLNQQQQTEALLANMTDMTDFARYIGCGERQPVEALGQRQVKTRTPGSCIAQAQTTAVGTSAVSAPTAATAENYSSGLAAILGDCSQDSSTANAAGQLLQQDELCQLGASIASKSQRMRPRPVAESARQLCGSGEPLHLLSAPPASAMPAASEMVTVTAYGAMDSLAGHVRSFPTCPTAADTSAVQTTSISAVSGLDNSSHTHVARQLGSHADNAQQPVLQAPPVLVAQSNHDRNQGQPVSPARLSAVQQQPPQQKEVSTDAVDVAVETEHRWSLSAAWAEQRQWLAARRSSGEGDAKWELDESGSMSGDSEGSVSSESTLRPSSVGRCRVNFGRHAKVRSF